MNQAKKIIAVAIAGVILSLYSVYAVTRISGYTGYFPVTQRIFRLSPDRVKSIEIWSNSKRVQFTHPDELNNIITQLNATRYFYCYPSLPITTGGWEHYLIIETAERSIACEVGRKWIEIRGMIYRVENGYFENLLSLVD